MRLFQIQGALIPIEAWIRLSNYYQIIKKGCPEKFKTA